MRYIYLFYIFVLCAFLVACGSATVVEQPDVVEEQQDVDLENVFYFEFDKAEIQPQAYPILDSHVQAILAAINDNPDIRINIEGHCDERGTEEYNIALGEKRAQAISRYLRVQGVPAENIDTVSYGELDPAVDDSNEEAWALNRRAVVFY